MALVKDVNYSNEGVVQKFDQPSNDNDNKSSNVAEGQTVVSNLSNSNYKFPITDAEKAYGIDIDVFGRFPPYHIPKKYGKPIYHWHTEPSIRDLEFIWNELKCIDLNVKHLDNNYTICTSHTLNYNLITRRCIWPLLYQNSLYETLSFQYNLCDINKYFKFCIILLHGGKFVISIYHGNECIYHKTERAYVTRGNRNGKREINFLSNKTKKNKGSAGSMKRAWNEMHLKENIQEILSQKQNDLMTCSKIFIHAPSSINKLALFGDNNEQSYLYPNNDNLMKQRLKECIVKNASKRVNQYRLWKKDPRIMTVPITTSKATLAEAHRVHYWLATCWLNIN